MKNFLSKIKGFAEKEFDPRKYFLLLCGLFAGFCILASLFTFLLDPYVYFHRSWGLKPHFVKSYAMIPGLLRHEEYDTVLFGSSIAQNFRLSDLDTLYNGKSIKATSPGLPAEALGKYLSLALEKDSFRHGIIAVDLMAFAKCPQTSPRLRYDYLYKKTLFPAKYLLSTDSLISSFKLIRGNLKVLFSKKKVKDMERDFMFGWYKKCSKAHLEAGIRETKRRKLSPSAIPPEAAQRMEKYLFSHIKNNPGRTFDLFLPPYNIYFWCALQHTGKLDGYLSFRDHFITRAQEFPNVKLHDFQAAENIICNMELYRDDTHYNRETNVWLVREMKKGSYLIKEAQGKKNTLKIRELYPRYFSDYLKL